MRENLTDIMVSAFEDKDPEAAYAAVRALEGVLLGRLYMLKYLETNSTDDLERGRNELGAGLESAYEQMVLLIDDPGRKRLLSGFRVAYLQAFESVVETIQTRNRLIADKINPLDELIST